MGSLAESMRQPAMPRFEDGSASLRELMRRIAEDVVNAIMGAEADQLAREASTAATATASAAWSPASASMTIGASVRLSEKIGTTVL